MTAPSVGRAAPRAVAAHVRAEGCSGIRSIRIRDFLLLSDAAPECAGFHLGPSPPELQLGALGSSLTDSFLAEAAARGVPLEGVEVDVVWTIDSPAGTGEGEPGTPQTRDIRYTVHLRSPAPAEQVAALQAAVEAACPILNLLIHPQAVRGQIVHDLGPVADPIASPN